MVKEDNQKSIAYSLVSLLKKIVFGFIILIISIIGCFLYYINQYDSGSYQSVDATGVYNLVDSDGNVIATDLTAKDIQKMMEIINNGKN